MTRIALVQQRVGAEASGPTICSRPRCASPRFRTAMSSACATA